MKILIAGDGKVGATLTRQLSAEGYDLTLIDSNPHVLESSVEQYDVMGVQGNCATKAVLQQAGVAQAELLIAATSADEVNLLCCMTAHELNPNLHTIARIRNPEYTDQIYEMRDAFAISLAVNPEKQAAVEIERLLKYPGFLKRDTFAKGRVEIVELRVEKGGMLNGVALCNIYGVVKCQVLVCAVLRGGNAIMPDGAFVLSEGDRVFVTAPAANLTILLKNLHIITHKVRRVLICGGGRVSYYLADQLQNQSIDVQLVERDHDRCVQLAGLLPRVNVIEGDASSQELLENEGIGDCDAVVAMTGLDELNMVISLYGHSRGVGQTITKLSRMASSGILDNLPLGSVVCPKELCCNTIVRYVRAVQNQTGAAVAVHLIADGKAEAVEFLVGETARHCGEPLKNIRLRSDVLVACITRGANTVIPNGDASFARGDTLIVVTNGSTVLHQLNDIFA